MRHLELPAGCSYKYRLQRIDSCDGGQANDILYPCKVFGGSLLRVQSGRRGPSSTFPPDLPSPPHLNLDFTSRHSSMQPISILSVELHQRRSTGVAHVPEFQDMAIRQKEDHLRSKVRASSRAPEKVRICWLYSVLKIPRTMDVSHMLVTRPRSLVATLLASRFAVSTTLLITLHI